MALTPKQTAKALILGPSPFVTGAEFKITGTTSECIDESGIYYPVFVTTLGSLSIPSCLRAIPIKPYEDTDGTFITTVQPRGTFHDKLRSVLAQHRGETTNVVLPFLVEAFKDDTIVVRLREYVTKLTKFGDKAVPLVHLDLKVD
ncbi:MAG: hypothetical protein NC241_07560 [Bacteroides sp.]|nr:hypothetical protein [Bacteroides sp.]MCM1456525.1 hypothetical protein [Lachnoclostridium sp.]